MFGTVVVFVLDPSVLHPADSHKLEQQLLLVKHLLRFLFVKVSAKSLDN